MASGEWFGWLSPEGVAGCGGRQRELREVAEKPGRFAGRGRRWLFWAGEVSEAGRGVLWLVSGPAVWGSGRLRPTGFVVL